MMGVLRRSAIICAATGGLLVAGVGTASADTAVQVTVPAGAHSLYIFQGAGPEGESNWETCYPLDGSAGTKTPRVPAQPNQAQWNFYAYDESGCPLDAGVVASANDVTAPQNLSTWLVALH
jgi:hypothetical protein